MVATFSLTQSNLANVGSRFQAKLKPELNSPDSVSKKTSLYLTVNLSEFTFSLNKRLLKEIRQYLQVSIKRSDRTKAIAICTISKDNCKEYWYFLYVVSQAHKNTLCMHLNEWLFKSFSKAQVQAITLYFIRVNSVNANEF